MIEENINSISISKIGDGIENNHWLPIEITLRARWKNSIPKLIICTGEVVIPPPDDWLGIINPLKTRQNLAEISRNELCHPLHNKKNTRVFSFVDYNCL